MLKIKKGDIVGRNSYGKDIIFSVDRIIKLNNGKYLALLKGLTSRIEADAFLNDLEIIDSKIVNNNLSNLDHILEKRIERNKVRENNTRRSHIYTGRILHLDRRQKI